MKITAIIVTYDNPCALEIILQSIIRQRTMPDEVIIADDGSGPETTSVIGKYQSIFPCKLIRVWQEHLGFRAARIRNKAITASTGDYLVFSDGDLFWHEKFIMDFKNRIKEKTASIGSRVFLSEETSVNCLSSNILPLIAPFFSGAISGNRLNSVRMPFLGSMFPEKTFSVHLRGGLLGVWKSDILAINGWNESFSGWGLEDTELVARLYFSGIKLRKVKFAGITYHLWHPVSTREGLTGNQRLLHNTIESRLTWCSTGLVKDENP